MRAAGLAAWPSALLCEPLGRASSAWDAGADLIDAESFIWVRYRPHHNDASA